MKFNVGLNAYDSGEIVTKLEVSSGSKHKLKSKTDCVIQFIGDNDRVLDTSENISILSQRNYKLVDKKGKVIFTS